MGVGFKRKLTSLYRDFCLATGINETATFGVYPYMFDPSQLQFLANCISSAAQVSGNFVEAGCARGATTVYLKKSMTSLCIDKPYIAIDTFSGFPLDQAMHEVESRNKPRSIRYAFTDNKRTWYDHSLRLAGVTGVRSIEADVATFDFSTVGPIAFCLLDVDLYIPIKASLPHIYENLSVGGIVVVDDCEPNSLYDGALQAYEEFVSDHKLPRSIECKKLGVIRKVI